MVEPLCHSAPPRALANTALREALPSSRAPQCATSTQKAWPPCFCLPFGRQGTAGKGCAFGPRRLRSTGAPGQRLPQVNLWRGSPPHGQAGGQHPAFHGHLVIPQRRSGTPAGGSLPARGLLLGPQPGRVGGTAAGRGCHGGPHIPAALTWPAACSKAGPGLLSL